MGGLHVMELIDLRGRVLLLKRWTRHDSTTISFQDGRPHLQHAPAHAILVKSTFASAWVFEFRHASCMNVERAVFTTENHVQRRKRFDANATAVLVER
jgi:hypothetical protein